MANESEKTVVIIGGGIAGMECSAYLAAMGYHVVIIEKSDKLGGHLLKWEKLFPTKRLGSEVLNYLKQGIQGNITTKLNTEVVAAKKIDNKHEIFTNDGERFLADAVLISTGYDTFDARKKEEYGYGIYDNVITSAELEEYFLTGKPILTASGKTPQRIAIIHCVGSRDEKVGNVYCSKVCCVTGVKQAIEIKERLPQAEVFCFYMDLRMFGMKFEELYKEAQEKWHVNFIRGRLSEACENMDGSIVVKSEDTLAGKPLKMSVDLVVLLVGFVPSKGTTAMGKLFGLEFNTNRFIKALDEHTMTNVTHVPGVFLAGTSSSPRTITNTLLDARSAAAQIVSYLENMLTERRTQESFSSKVKPLLP